MLGHEPARATDRATQRPATCRRAKSHVGLGLAARSSGEAARVPAQGYARGSALIDGKVYPGSTNEAPGWRRAMWQSAAGGRKRRLNSVLRWWQDPVPGGGGGQWDPTATGEREESEGPARQWRTTTEAALTGAGEDGVGAVEMLSVAARSGSGGWVRRQGKRGCYSRGRVRERTEKEGAGTAAGAF
jgi:hypothetical protein